MGPRDTTKGSEGTSREKIKGSQVKRCLLALILTASAYGQPKITAIVSSADFKPGLALSGLTTIFGSNLSDSAYSAGLPFPVKLGQTEVFFCDLSNTFPNGNQSASGCATLPILYAGPEQINILLPDSLPMVLNQPSTGGFFTVRVAGILDVDSAGASQRYYPILESEPRIFWMGYDCFIDPRYKDATKSCGLTNQQNLGLYQADRGAVTDQLGALLSSSHPAKLGQYYTIWLTGLGPVKSGKVLALTQLTMANVPIYGSSDDAFIDDAQSFIGPSPQFTGLYQINFQLPAQIATGTPSVYPPFPCGNYAWELTLEVLGGSPGLSQQVSNLVSIPVVVKNGDVPCSP